MKDALWKGVKGLATEEVEKPLKYTTSSWRGWMESCEELERGRC